MKEDNYYCEVCESIFDSSDYFFEKRVYTKDTLGNDWTEFYLICPKCLENNNSSR